MALEAMTEPFPLPWELPLLGGRGASWCELRSGLGHTAHWAGLSAGFSCPPWSSHLKRKSMESKREFHKSAGVLEILSDLGSQEEAWGPVTLWKPLYLCLPFWAVLRVKQSYKWEKRFFLWGWKSHTEGKHTLHSVCHMTVLKNEWVFE